MDFFTCDSVKTSDSKDYESNVWDKGHMAPAADFNCDKIMLKKTSGPKPNYLEIVGGI
jgi:hypothetical protein